ncbi:rod shape-determining protein MreC [Arhodomonas aquaeolei]|nr:rod shape-determining protein MreC [Arhodomonas aquaeolei]
MLSGSDLSSGEAIKPLFARGPSITARLVLLALASVALMTLDHREGYLQPVRYALTTAVYPVHVAAELPAEIGRFFSREFRSRRALVSEIERLQDKLLLSQARLQKLDALEVENIRLRKLLDSSYEVGESVLIAELMRVDFDPHTHLVRIDKGARDGLFAGQPVLDANGVVGQVDTVGPFTATVRLISDPSHAIPVQVNRNGVRAVAVGTGDLSALKLTNLPNNTDIRKGDLLLTSGLGGRFPSGYPVGRVSAVDKKPGRPFAEVTVKTAASLDRLQEVLLVRREGDVPQFAGGSAVPEEQAPGS